MIYPIQNESASDIFSTADGTLYTADFTFPEMFEAYRVYVKFFSDAAGQNIVTPTDGTVVIEGSHTIGIWNKPENVSIISASECGSSPTYVNPEFFGRLEKGRVTFSGVTGAAYAKIIFHCFNNFASVNQYDWLLTGTSKRRGNRRVQTDNDETSFEEGKQFIFSHEFSIATGSTLVFKVVSSADYEVLGRTVSVDAGGVKITEIIGGTSSGTFAAITPSVKNRMSVAPVNSTNVSVGYLANATITGGTSRVLARIVSAGATAQQSTVGGTLSSKIGCPSETRFLKFEVIGNSTATGVYEAFWEDR